MANNGATDGVSYRRLLTDPALVSVFLISGVSALGNHAVPVALPVIGETFALTEAEIGVVMSAFTVAVLVALPVVSVLADVYGRRPVVIPSLLLFGATGLATLAADSYPALLVLRALQGAAFTGTLPLTTTLTGDLYTGAEGSSAQGFRSGLNGLASAIAPVVAGFLAVLAWQYPFVLFGLSIPVAGLVYRYYPEPIERREGSPEDLLSDVAAYWATLRRAVDRRLGVFMAGGFVLFFLKGGYATFLPVFVVSGLGAPVTVAGTILGVYGGTRVVVSPMSGSVMARAGRRNTILLGTGFGTLGMIAIPFSPTVVVLGAASAVYALGESLLNPVLNDGVAAAAEADQRAGVMAGLQILKNVALTVAPVGMGAIIGAAGFTSAFVLAGTLGVGYFALVVVGYRPAAVR